MGHEKDSRVEELSAIEVTLKRLRTASHPEAVRSLLCKNSFETMEHQLESELKFLFRF